MALPFVRDLFAVAEKLPEFLRVIAHLRANTGRIGVSGLNPPSKPLFIAEAQRAAGRPLIVLVRNNEAADELLPVIQAYSELIHGAPAESIATLPTRDVLPFQNLSPHPEIQEQRAIALWKIASGAASIVLVPAAASLFRLNPAEYYGDLARVIRRGETFDIANGSYLT